MRKRLWGCGIGLVVVAIICIALRLSSIDHVNLLDRSTRITSVQGWGMERPDINLSLLNYSLMGGGSEYRWIGNSQILFFHDLIPIQVTGTHTNGRSMLHLAWPDSVGTPTLYDVTTHSERPLSKLADLFHHSRGKAAGTTVSLDGARLLWEDGQNHVHSALLDGSRHVSIEEDGRIDTRWPADRKQFYTYTWGEDDQKNDLIAVSLWDVNSGKSIDQLQFARPRGYTLLGDCVLTPNGSLVTNNLRRQSQLNLYRIPPAPDSVLSTVTPTLPSGATVEALVYSPQGDRLAWVINRSVPSPFAFLQRWLPHFKSAPQQLASLWVSGAMGDNLHEIGHIPVRMGGRQFYLIDYVRWQPDGKTLSFVSNDILYTVPAD